MGLWVCRTASQPTTSNVLAGTTVQHSHGSSSSSSRLRHPFPVYDVAPWLPLASPSPIPPLTYSPLSLRALPISCHLPLLIYLLSLATSIQSINHTSTTTTTAHTGQAEEWRVEAAELQSHITQLALQLSAARAAAAGRLAEAVQVCISFRGCRV